MFSEVEHGLLPLSIWRSGYAEFSVSKQGLEAAVVMAAVDSPRQALVGSPSSDWAGGAWAFRVSMFTTAALLSSGSRHGERRIVDASVPKPVQAKPAEKGHDL
jgi:hypothetical protein